MEGREKYFKKTKGPATNIIDKIRVNLKIIEDWKSEYESVNRLLYHLRYVKSGSILSRNSHLQSLNKFCLFIDKKPNELVKMNNKEIEKMLNQFLLNYDYARTKKTICQALKTFFVANNRKKINFPKFYCPTRMTKIPKFTPSVDEAWKMAEYAGSIKAKLVIMFLFTTGLRNSTLRAIRLGDIKTKNLNVKDLTLKDQLRKGYDTIAILITLGMKEDVPGACKGGIEYFVYIPKETTEVLKLYLVDRKRKNGKINDDEFLFCSNYRGYKEGEDVNTPITAKGLGKIVHEAAKRAGIEEWSYTTPQSLRRTYDEIMSNQRKKIMSEQDKEYFMGHILPGVQDHYYSGEIRKKNIDRKRKKYSKVEFKPKTEFDEEILIRIASINNIDYSKVIKEVKKRTDGKYSINDAENVLREFITNRTKPIQKRISQDQLNSYLEKSWVVTFVLPDGTIIVSKKDCDNLVNQTPSSPLIFK
jgi:integrase